MSEVGWVEGGVLGLILLFCLWYIYRSARALFSKKEGISCGCSAGNSQGCPSKAERVKKGDQCG
ncbi:MAG: hypothetical protein HQL72_04080 [Magnetococcales bacterium]|nr:hypothetical protein [Magnetococcales bacterium]